MESVWAKRKWLSHFAPTGPILKTPFTAPPPARPPSSLRVTGRSAVETIGPRLLRREGNLRNLFGRQGAVDVELVDVEGVGVVVPVDHPQRHRLTGPHPRLIRHKTHSVGADGYRLRAAAAPGQQPAEQKKARE